jgi:hypothetical protein
MTASLPNCYHHKKKPLKTAKNPQKLKNTNKFEKKNTKNPNKNHKSSKTPINSKKNHEKPEQKPQRTR